LFVSVRSSVSSTAGTTLTIQGAARVRIPPLQPRPSALLMIAGGTGESGVAPSLVETVTECYWRRDHTHAGPCPRLQVFLKVLHKLSCSFGLMPVFRDCTLGGFLLWSVVFRVSFSNFLLAESKNCGVSDSFERACSLVPVAGGSVVLPMSSVLACWKSCKRIRL
jgi:hypothetical protein